MNNYNDILDGHDLVYSDYDITNDISEIVDTLKLATSHTAWND
jgi:hypothetical protein